MCADDAVSAVADALGELGLEATVGRGRFAEERNLTVAVGGELVVMIKLFLGRAPYYSCWAELYGASPLLKPGEAFPSDLERGVLSAAARALGGGDMLYVEYLYDRETEEELSRSYPAPVTRLGHMMFKLGFTWFKDWYYPEGGLEGEPKLEGVKPMGRDEEARQLASIKAQAKEFAENARCDGDGYCLRSLGRARDILAST